MLGALQSLGSWKGMLLYAAFSGFIAAYGVIFNITYLLVAAMLIAPMGAPAMVCVIGTAIGDWKMFGRGAARFVAAIAVLVFSAAALGYAYRLSISSTTMESVTSFSNWIVLLALVGGAAGAQAQILSGRNSLVTGTATGFLIAVSLSPTSAVLGLSIVLGHWAYIGSMTFVVLLTFAGIVVGGFFMLWTYGIRPQAPSTQRGSAVAQAALTAGVSLAAIGLVLWQVYQGPKFQKADLSEQAVELTQEAGKAVSGVRLLDVSAHFVETNEGPASAILISVVVEQTDTTADKEKTRSAVREVVKQQVDTHMTSVAPYVQVSVLP